jgi:hypothetical protein
VFALTAACEIYVLFYALWTHDRAFRRRTLPVVGWIGLNLTKHDGIRALLFIVIASVHVAPGQTMTPFLRIRQQTGTKIHRHIFSQFADIWAAGLRRRLVGPGSTVPNTRGIRNDV